MILKKSMICLLILFSIMSAQDLGQQFDQLAADAHVLMVTDPPPPATVTQLNQNLASFQKQLNLSANQSYEYFQQEVYRCWIPFFEGLLRQDADRFDRVKPAINQVLNNSNVSPHLTSDRRFRLKLLQFYAYAYQAKFQDKPDPANLFKTLDELKGYQLSGLTNRDNQIIRNMLSTMAFQGSEFFLKRYFRQGKLTEIKNLLSQLKEYINDNRFGGLSGNVAASPCGTLNPFNAGVYSSYYRAVHQYLSDWSGFSTMIPTDRCACELQSDINSIANNGINSLSAVQNLGADYTPLVDNLKALQASYQIFKEYNNSQSGVALPNLSSGIMDAAIRDQIAYRTSLVNNFKQQYYPNVPYTAKPIPTTDPHLRFWDLYRRTLAQQSFSASEITVLDSCMPLKAHGLFLLNMNSFLLSSNGQFSFTPITDELMAFLNISEKNYYYALKFINSGNLRDLAAGNVADSIGFKRIFYAIEMLKSKKSGTNLMNNRYATISSEYQNVLKDDNERNKMRVVTIFLKKNPTEAEIAFLSDLAGRWKNQPYYSELLYALYRLKNDYTPLCEAASLRDPVACNEVLGLMELGVEDFPGGCSNKESLNQSLSAWKNKFGSSCYALTLLKGIQPATINFGYPYETDCKLVMLDQFILGWKYVIANIALTAYNQHPILPDLFVNTIPYLPPSDFIDLWIAMQPVRTLDRVDPVPYDPTAANPSLLPPEEGKQHIGCIKAGAPYIVSVFPQGDLYPASRIFLETITKSDLTMDLFPKQTLRNVSVQTQNDNTIFYRVQGNRNSKLCYQAQRFTNEWMLTVNGSKVKVPCSELTVPAGMAELNGIIYILDGYSSKLLAFRDGKKITEDDPSVRIFNRLNPSNIVDLQISVNRLYLVRGDGRFFFIRGEQSSPEIDSSFIITSSSSLTRTAIFNESPSRKYVYYITSNGELYWNFNFNHQSRPFADYKKAVEQGLRCPSSLTLDEQGHLYVTDPSSNLVFRFNSTGYLVDTYNLDTKQGFFAGALSKNDNKTMIYLLSGNHETVQADIQ